MMGSYALSEEGRSTNWSNKRSLKREREEREAMWWVTLVYKA
jgi:hypothetical protein